MASKFAKAKAQQPNLRLAFYGPPGSGKTFTSLLVAEGLAQRDGKRIAFIDTEESGTDFYALDVPDRATHPEAFDFDVLRTQSLAEAVEAVKSISPETHSVIVIDSITHLWEAAMNAAERTRKDTVKFGEWAKVKRPYKNFIKWLMESPYHVLICGRMKNVFEDDDKGDIKKVGVTMNAERDTAYEPQVCIRLDPKVDAKDTTRTTYYAYVEKDRTGLLAGRTLANLGFSHFAPILALLGGEQVKYEDPDAVAMRDNELMEREQEEIELKKNAKSRELLAVYSNKLREATTPAELATIANELKTKRGQLEDHHREVLLGAYEDRVKEVNSAQV